MFRQAPGAVPAALELLGAPDSPDAAAVLGAGLATGQCLYRDVRDRIGLIQISQPVLPELHAAFDTTPTTGNAARPAPRQSHDPPADHPTVAGAPGPGTTRELMAAARARARRHRRTPLAAALAGHDDR